METRNWRSFTEARKFVHSLKLKSGSEWKEYKRSDKKPVDIPKNPDNVYKKEWISMGDWLGTGTIQAQKRQYRSFTEARKFVHSLKLSGQKGWEEYCKSDKKPDNIPNYPRGVYLNKGWISWGDWVGTGKIHPSKRQYRSFTQARKFARSLGFKKNAEWKKYYRAGKLPIDIPSGPQQSYSNHGWKGWGDWLGTGNLHPRDRKYRTFVQARKFVRNLKLKGGSGWDTYCKSGKKPDDIPRNPDNVYKKEWISMGDWFGTGTISVNKRHYRSFVQARKFVHSLKLKNGSEFREYSKSNSRPDDIPGDPRQVYKKEWISMGDWLGTGRIAHQVKSANYLSWDEAKPIYRKLAKEYGLNGRADWSKFAKTNPKLINKLRIPRRPWSIYTKERVWSKMKNE